MSIIAISRQLASLGDEVASKVANSLGFEFIDKKQIEDSLFSEGLSDSVLKKYDEKKPGFVASMTKNRDVYFHFLKSAILKSAASGKKIFIGRGAFALLGNISGVLTVRLVSPFDVRVSRLIKQLNCTEKNAIQLLEKNDNDRAGFHRSFFDLDSNSAENYHLVLNTGAMELDSVAKVIVDAYKEIQTPETEKKALESLKLMLNAQKIVIEVLFSQNIPIYFLDVGYDGDKMILHGVAASVVDVEKALSIAKEMSNGKEVVSTISIVQNFKAYP